MALFRRKAAPPTDGTHPISDFWTWWSAESDHLDPRRESAATAVLADRLRAVHPDLSWHFGPGLHAQHRLTVSAGGVAEVRPYAERWLRAAPAADATWEFRSSQEADPDALDNVLSIAGQKLRLAETVFSVQVAEDDFRVHVGVHHPAFGDLPDSVPAQTSFLVLDWLLGEDDVERWLGTVNPLVDRPADAVGGDALLEAVAGLAERRDPAAWTMASWQEPDGAPGLALFRRGLRWVDRPILDRHQMATASYRAQQNGLPADGEELDRLRALEDTLEALLGERGVLVAHESSRGARVFHVYTDSEDQNVDDLLDQWAREAGLRLEAQPDPAWMQVRHFTG